MKYKKIITEDFFIGNLGDVESTNEILNSYIKIFSKNVNDLIEIDRPGLIGSDTDEGFYVENIRKCYISWMEVSSNNFIEVGLRKTIKNVNDIIWKMKLDDEWQSGIQFTKYIGKGQHYSWHKDYYGEEIHEEIRRISIVYCLSKKSDYIGGEFQIKKSDGKIYTIKFDFGDFIVFPSDKLHRVKPLKSGTRITMVGWYR